MKKTYQGSCHCGAVRYEADLDLAAGTIKCNCSFCGKNRNWLIAVKGNDFRLLAGESDLTQYQFNARRIEHMFCKHCGIRSFSRAAGGAPAERFHAVVVSCLDNVDVTELVNAPVMYVNGREDDFKSAPPETRHL
jgi:hypothetical protein